jgi:hypothetical protein
MSFIIFSPGGIVERGGSILARYGEIGGSWLICRRILLLVVHPYDILDAYLPNFAIREF